jgi:class 3 adenylate cyclase
MTRPGKSFSIFRYRYMVASGLPECRDDHAEAVAEFALDLLDIVSRFNKSNQLANLNRPTLAVRAGIHTGPVIAGIIGDKKFCYDVWGAGVDGASAMEQSGVADRIHLSQSIGCCCCREQRSRGKTRFADLLSHRALKARGLYRLLRHC